MELKPISEIKLELGINPNGRVQKFFTDTCVKRMDKYIPKDVGNLRDIIDKGTDYVTYEVPYAHYQYVNQFPEDHYTTAGTGPYWDKRMVSAEMEDVVKEVQNYVKRSR